MTSEPTLNGDAVQSGAVDNGLATATMTAVAGQRRFVSGVEADYSAAVAAVKTVTLKFGTTTKFIIRWDFSKGPCIFPFPAVQKGDYAQAASIELEASGTPGTTGRVTAFFFTA